METVPDALASTPATFSLKTTLPLERGLDSKSGLLKAKLQRQRLPLETSSQFSPGPPSHFKDSALRAQNGTFRVGHPRNLLRNRVPAAALATFSVSRPTIHRKKHITVPLAP